MQIRIVVRGAIGLNLAPEGNCGMLVRVPVMTNLHISHLLLHSRTPLFSELQLIVFFFRQDKTH